MSIDMVKAVRAFESTVQPLRARATAAEVEGEHVLTARVFSGGGSGAKATASSWSFPLQVTNVRAVPAGITDVRGAMDHLDDLMRADPNARAGAVLQGRDGARSIGHVGYVESYPKARRNGEVVSTFLRKDANESTRLGGDLWHSSSPLGTLPTEAPTELDDAGRRITKPQFGEWVSVQGGRLPVVRNLDLTGPYVADETHAVDPATIDIPATARVETRSRAWSGAARWNESAPEPYVAHPGSATRYVFHGKPLPTSGVDATVRIDRVDATVKGIVGHDGRREFLDA